MKCPNCMHEYDKNIYECPECMIPLVKELDQDGNAVVILRTGSKPEVAVLKSISDEAEIPYAVKGEELQDILGWGSIGAGVNYAVGHIELLVNKNSLSEVVELLKQMRQDMPENTSEEEEE